MNGCKTTSAIRGTTLAIKERAINLRQHMTPAENLLWKALKGRQVADLRFRAQHPVGNFILDFYCPAHKLVVEVDGGIHEANRERDDVRTAYLMAFGYQVVRVRNEELDTDLLAVLERTRQTVQSHLQTEERPVRARKSISSRTS